MSHDVSPARGTNILPPLPDDPAYKELTKAESIVRRIQLGIVGGIYQPGSRLPMRSEIESAADASWVTIQRAFDRLKANGDVRSVKGQGTFVTDRPPCLFRYGVIFPARPPEKPSLYIEAVQQAAEELTRRGPVEFRLYRQAYDYLTGEATGEAYAELEKDVQNLSLAGLIFARHPSPVSDHSFYTQTALPRFAFSTDPPGFPAVGGIDMGGTRDMVEKGLRYLAGQGKHRVGALVPGARFGNENRRHLMEATAEAGMEIRRYWVQSPHVEEPDWTANSAELLMRLPPEDRPNGLLIMDDHLVCPAAKGLRAAGVRVPEDVTVLAHCNFPRVTCPDLPFIRLGYDLREALAKAVAWLRKRAARAEIPARSKLPARFEADLLDPGDIADALRVNR